MLTLVPLILTFLWSLLTGLRGALRPRAARRTVPTPHPHINAAAARELAQIERTLKEFLDLYGQWKAGTLPAEPGARHARRRARHARAPRPRRPGQVSPSARRHARPCPNPHHSCASPKLRQPPHLCRRGRVLSLSARPPPDAEYAPRAMRPSTPILLR